MNVRNQRSVEAKKYRKLYKSQRWKYIRDDQFMIMPLCEWCMKKGRVTIAKVCHHKVPHRGNVEAFYKGPFVSLCKDCHDLDAQAFENRGFKKDIGADGWPLDKKHPANVREQNV